LRLLLLLTSGAGGAALLPCRGWFTRVSGLLGPRTRPTAPPPSWALPGPSRAWKKSADRVDAPVSSCPII